MQVRICTKCHEVKTIDNFSKKLTGYSPSCKECYKKYWNNTIQKRNENKLRYYANGGKEKSQEWFQKNKINVYKSKNHIYSAIRNRCSKVSMECCSKSDFYLWYDKQIKECSYCSVNIEIIEQFGERSKRLTIDRIDNNKGYTLENICLACEICNHIKSNVFTSYEMKEISPFVMKRWKNKIANSILQKKL